MNKVVLVTGGFDPLHSGHIAYFRAAKELGDYLIVGINSDAWLERKKDRAFMNWNERATIVKNLKMVDYVIEFDDTDDSARNAIKTVKETWKDDEIIVANGGDRNAQNIPETGISGVTYEWGVGGTYKMNSSSDLLTDWTAFWEKTDSRTDRPWGHYDVLYSVPGVKVKTLTIEPGQSLSLQRHHMRTELWLVAQGRCCVGNVELNTHDYYKINPTVWHQLRNPYDDPCTLVEVQYGRDCIEEDIERH